jgi:hypothetical protein
VDNNKLTTVSELMPHTIYTIRVEAYTAIGPGPPSPPVQVTRVGRSIGVARFFLVQITKTGRNMPNDPKIYQMAITYIFPIALK